MVGVVLIIDFCGLVADMAGVSMKNMELEVVSLSEEVLSTGVRERGEGSGDGLKPGGQRRQTQDMESGEDRSGEDSWVEDMSNMEVMPSEEASMISDDPESSLTVSRDMEPASSISDDMEAASIMSKTSEEIEATLDKS